MPTREEIERLKSKGAIAVGCVPIPGITVVDEEEAEKSDIVICVYAGQEWEGFKATNIYAPCADCGSPITYRPHAPKTPPKVCVRCAMKRVDASK